MSSDAPMQSVAPPHGGGPLAGVRFVEFAGKGPGPFCGMLLSDLGAEVICIERIPRPEDGPDATHMPVLQRNRRSVALDLKQAGGLAAARALLARADGLIEGFRPGVMERLGLGPEPCLALNPRLIYGRITGWGQTGPLAARAGHDINYISITGALHAIGAAHQPVPPINLLGDYGGGALYLALGLVSGVLHARASGTGQVIDVAMSDATASLMTSIYGLLHEGRWQDERASNLLDGGAPFYSVYACADGGHLAVGPIEPQFFESFLKLAGLAADDFEGRESHAQWPAQRARLEALFASQPRAHWEAVFADSDACVTSVLSLHEAPYHAHNRARASFVEVDGKPLPAPAPRFSHTPAAMRSPPPATGAHSEQVLRACGCSLEEINKWKKTGAVYQAPKSPKPIAKETDPS